MLDPIFCLTREVSVDLQRLNLNTKKAVHSDGFCGLDGMFGIFINFYQNNYNFYFKRLVIPVFSNEKYKLKLQIDKNQLSFSLRNLYDIPFQNTFVKPYVSLYLCRFLKWESENVKPRPCLTQLYAITNIF